MNEITYNGTAYRVGQTVRYAHTSDDAPGRIESIELRVDGPVFLVAWADSTTPEECSPYDVEPV